MKKLLILGLLITCSMHVAAFNLDSKITNFKAGQFCGDDCDGSCKQPKEKA